MMKIPSGMSETEVMDTIDKILKGLSVKFKFGYFDADDLYQEGWLFAMKAMETYDDKLPLENFLRVALRTRFINFKRDNYSRYEPPCISCPFYDKEGLKAENKCLEFLNKDDCDKWAAWKKRNKTKAGLMRPIDIDTVSEDKDPFELSDHNLADIRSKIDRALPAELRGDFLKMLDGVVIPKIRRDSVREFIAKMGVCDIL